MRHLVLLALAALFGACASTSSSLPVPDLENAQYLEKGMSMVRVLDFMGNPNKTEISRDLEEWHYCAPEICHGEGCQQEDQYVALFFFRDSLIAFTEYSVSTRSNRTIYGSCESSIKRGSYEEPPEVGVARRQMRGLR